MLIKYNGINKWNGQYPKTYMGGDASGIILDIGTGDTGLGEFNGAKISKGLLLNS